MEDRFERNKLLLGEEKVNELANKKVVIFGIGGVGGYVVEALARAGVGEFVIIDRDVVNISNINRQIIALESTIGRKKVDVAKERILQINPNAKVTAICEFVTPEYLENFDFNVDFVVDAIDNITAKIKLAYLSYNNGFNLISCMGTGNKLRPEDFEITDLFNTINDPVAKMLRKKLRPLGVKKLQVLYSKEDPIDTKTRVPASISFTPAIAGLRIAEYVIKKLINLN